MTRRNLTDAELFAASVASPHVIGEIFDRHAPELLRYLTRRIGSDDAQDVLSQTFLVAFERRRSFDAVARSARPWLYGIASHLLKRRRRDESRFFRALARLPVSPDGTEFEDRATARLDAAGLARVLAGALARLSADDRNVVLLVAWSGLSQEDIASALDVPVGTVKSRLHRARKRLREDLPIESMGMERLSHE